MDLTSLKNLIYHKAKIDSAITADVNMVISVIDAVVSDFSRRYPWSFLKKRDATKSLASGEYQLELPTDFVSLISTELVDSGNIVYPVHSFKERAYAEGNPDLTETGRPYLAWIYYSSGKWYLEFRPKSDGAYTVRLSYKATLSSDDLTFVPNGLVIFWGCMSAFAPPDEMALYKKMYENGILSMWGSDRVDMGEEPQLYPDEAVTAFNKYMESIH
jgi:hypothetical protein